MRARILEPSAENIAKAAEAIRGNDVVAMPTETVYGLAGAAFRPEALTRIFETKERPTFDPLILHVSASAGIQSVADLERMKLVDRKILGEKARRRTDLLIRTFWPGPLTLVLPKLPEVPDLATSGLPTVAIRMPRHPVAQALLDRCETPLAAPSANRFGRISPTSARAVADELGDRIDLVLDGGNCEIGLESTVLAIEPDGKIRLLRPGGISKSEIRNALQEEEKDVFLELSTSEAAATQGAPSPGMLESHYAPGKPLLILPGDAFAFQASTLKDVLRQAQVKALKSVGLLLFSKNAAEAAKHFSSVVFCPVVARSLTQKGDMNEAARNLFSEMRFLDQSNVDIIFSEPCPQEQGLGHAIADRLRRASAKKSQARFPK